MNWLGKGTIKYNGCYYAHGDDVPISVEELKLQSEEVIDGFGGLPKKSVGRSKKLKEEAES